MSEVWLIKTSDGEEYPLRTDGVCFYDGTYESIYNLGKGVTGHHGVGTTILSDPIPEIAGEELRLVQRNADEIFLPIRITGLDSSDFHKNMAKIRRSLNPAYEAQLWVTNAEGDTRVLYFHYLKGFESAIDGSARGQNWMSIPMYIKALDPYWYDQPGAGIDNVYYQEPWTTKFLTKTVSSLIVTQSTYNTSGGTTIWVEDSTGFAADQDIVIISVNTATANYREVQTIASVDANGHKITIKSGTGSGTLAHTYTVAHYAYISFIDPADHFLNPTPILETTLTDSGTIGEYTLTIADTALCAVGDIVRIIDPIKNVFEERVIATVTNSTTLTVTAKMVNTYLLANAPFVIVNRRVVNDDCVFVIYWLTGCPPCYRAITQLQALQVANPSLEIIYVEITKAAASTDCHQSGVDCIGMTAALATYPEGYAFSQACGPPLPAFYHVIGTVMPAVITLYRSGVFIKGWCGVHTTNVDAVSNSILLDACGNRMKWRLSRTWIGYKVPIDNTGDGIAYPIWTLYGPGRTPRLTNVTTGKLLQLDHDLLEGEVVVVDSRDGAHTCGSNREGGEFIAGYTDSEPCPTCHGIGTIPSTCESCGGTEVCPSCHGTGFIDVWIPNSFGTTALIGDMYNLRNELADTSQSFWGLLPTVNVVEMEMSSTNTTTSKIELQFLKKYEGI